MINEIIQQSVANIQSQKDKLLFDRICERVKTDEPINLNEESKRMFPRIKCNYNSIDQSEHWYWNDGSIKGLHLISFYSDPMTMEKSMDNIFSINLRYL